MRRRRKSRPPSGRIVVLCGTSDVAPMMAMGGPSPLQHRGEAGHRLAGGLLVMHQGNTDIAFGSIDALRLATNVRAGQHLQVRLAPQSTRGLFAVTDIEPQKEAAAGRKV